MRHIGLIKNTGKKCLVVFREIYDEHGNVADPNNCLVVELENLPDFAYQDVVSIVESDTAQKAPNMYDVLARHRLSDGSAALSWLHSTGRLRKYETSNVDLITSNTTTESLAKINRIIALQKSGYSEKEIENIIANDTDQPPRKIDNPLETDSNNSPTQKQDGVLTDEDLAKSYLEQSKNMLEQSKALFKESERLKNEAYELAPSLKKTRKSSSKTKDSVTTETN